MIPIIDLHCHPTMKIHLFKQDIGISHKPLADKIPSGMHVDLPGMKEAGVRVIFATHYIPEAGLGKMKNTKLLFKLLEKIDPQVTFKFEPDHDGEGAYMLLSQSMTLLENQIEKYSNEFNVVIPRSKSQFEYAWDSGKTIVVHAIEGSHHLGRNLQNDDWYIRNLTHLKGRGLAMITLAHFFENSICGTGGGIPPSEKKLFGYEVINSGDGGLSKAGEKVINFCFDNGIIIDLVHSTQTTRNKVYELIEERKKSNKVFTPLIFSHSGVRGLAEKYMTNKDDLSNLPGDDEIKKIASYGGVLGIIFMNYWLIGIEEDSIFKRDTGINYILDTIKYIKALTGTYDNISIGSDLDGFTQTPDDIYRISQMNYLREKLMENFDLATVQKICYENAMRVIMSGWN